MRLWVLTFDEPRFEEESPHSFSWGEARHATPEDLRELVAEAVAIELGHTMASIDPPIYGPNTYRLADLISARLTQGRIT